MSFGTGELVIVLIIVVLVFGASWLPKAARNLGRAKVELDKTQKQFNETKQQVVDATGVEKVQDGLKKANRALNSSPQGLLKGAAASAVAGSSSPAESDEVDATGQPIADAEIVDTETGTDNVTVDFTDTDD